MRTVFSLIEIGSKFSFVGSPVIWEKVSNFTAVIWEAPFTLYDEIISSSVLNGSFSTDSIITTWQ